MKIVVVASLLLLGGCAAGSHPRIRHVANAPDRCVAKRAQAYVGKVATPRLTERARLASRAEIVRYLHPDEMVTMEYQEGRLNVTLDAAGKITGVRCG